MYKEKNIDMGVNELWLEKVKSRLSEHSEPLPVSGWERLERELPSRPKLIPLYQKIAVVAAALIGVLSFVGLHLINEVPQELPSSHMASSIRNFDLPSMYVEPAKSILEHQLEKSRPHKVAISRLASIPDSKSILKKSELQDSIFIHVKLNIERKEKHEHSISKKDKLPEVDASFLALVDKPRSRQKGWSMALSIGNTGGKLNNAQGANDFQNALSPGTSYIDLDLMEASKGVVAIPEGQNLVFQNGLPYLQRNTRQIMSIDHKQPISVGLSFRQNLSKGFSIETGLIYSYLASDILYEGTTEIVNQKLHYLGIPLRANWNFWERKKIALYISAGGTVEKCVYGKTGTTTSTVDPVQLSATTAVGAQYNLSRHVGFYIEPGMAYYFDDGSDIQTIRKEQPWLFTLQAGFRLSY